jgi:tripartite-type tricarboxylate transporter receptor subunit TctC
VANVLIVHPSNPAKTVADVVEQARAKKGELTFSSGGIGTSHHMSGVLLEMRSGVKMTHVPYRATPAGIRRWSTARWRWACSTCRRSSA